MAHKNIHHQIEEEIYNHIQSFVSVLTDDNNQELSLPIADLIEVSNLTQTPLEEILKPIDFPYWSL